MSEKIIDKLVFAVGLDVEALNKGQKEAMDRLDALEKQAAKTGEHVKKITVGQEKEEKIVGVERSKRDKEEAVAAKNKEASFSRITKQVFALTTAYLGLGAIKSAVVEITKADNALGQFGRNIGMAPNKIKAWEVAATNLGLAAGDADTALQHAAKLAADYQRNIYSNDTMIGLGLLGINSTEFMDKNITAGERLLILSKAINSSVHERGMDRQVAMGWAQQAGFDPAILTMMLDYDDRLKSILATEEKLNTVSAESTSLAASRMSAWNTFSNSVQSMLRESLNGWTKLLGDSAALADAAKAKVDDLHKSGHPTAISSGGHVYEQMPDSTPSAHTNKDLLSEKAAASARNARGGNSAADTALADARFNAALATHGAAGDPSGDTDKLAIIAALEKEHGLPTGMLRGVYAAENSDGKGSGLSSKGAMGDFQLMPSNTKGIDPYNFTQAAGRSAEMLQGLLKQFKGDPDRTLAGYVGSPSTVDSRMLNDHATRAYIPKVESYMTGGNNSNNPINIGTVIMNTPQLTDAKGFASSLRDNVRNLGGIP